MLDAAHGAYLARETYLACHAHGGLYLGVHIARKDGADDAEVDGGVVHTEASSDVEEHILLCQLEAHALLEHGKEHVHAAKVEASGRALWGAIGGSAHEGLCLDEEGTYALNGRGDGDATHSLVAVGEEQLRGVAHLTQSVAAHLVDAQLGSASKAILDAAQDAVHVVLVALELQYAVDNVLQYLRSGDATLLVDVADENGGDVTLLGELEQ